MTTKSYGLLALAAAVLYAVSIPLNKILVEHMVPASVSAFLYLGAGVGMAAMRVARKDREPFVVTRTHVPYVVGMVILDIIAPLLLLAGLSISAAASASALTNFEIVATSIIALALFGEKISGRLWIAIVLITIASLLIAGGFSLDRGSLLILGATICWGLENNCTRALSHLDSDALLAIKGFGAGIGAAIVALLADGHLEVGWIAIITMIVGFLTYGLSINLYIRAQAHLGAAKTAAYYASAPFIGVALSFLILGESMPTMFWVGLGVMALATYFLITDSIRTQHTHDHTHAVTLTHSHDDGSVHAHEVTYTHAHLHAHGTDIEDHSHEHDLSDDDLARLVTCRG